MYKMYRSQDSADCAGLLLALYVLLFIIYPFLHDVRLVGVTIWFTPSVPFSHRFQHNAIQRGPRRDPEHYRLYIHGSWGYSPAIG